MQTIDHRLKLFLDQMAKGKAQIPDELIEEFGEACKKLLRKSVTPPPENNPYRVSNIGRPLCQIQMEQMGAAKEPLGYDFAMRMLFGDMIEQATVVLMKAAGITVEQQGAKTEMEIDGTKVPGHVDVVIDGKIWDVKSASPYAFSSKFAAPDGFQKIVEDDPFGYIGQGYLYSEGMGLPFGGWIAVNKSTGEIAVLEVPEIDDKYRQESLAKAKVSVKAIKDKEPFRRSYKAQDEIYYKKHTGNKTLCVTCAYCPYKHTCWAAEGLQFAPNPRSRSDTPKRNWYVGEIK